MDICLTNPTGLCQTRPAGCCPSGPGCGQDLVRGQCGGPGLAECQHGSLHLPSSGPTVSPGHKLLGRPGRLHLKNKNIKGFTYIARHQGTSAPLRQIQWGKKSYQFKFTNHFIIYCK